MELLEIKLIAKMYVKNKEGKFLVLLRSENDINRPGEWDLPGGTVDQGEDPNDAVLREVKEEANINIANSRVLTVHSDNNKIHIVRLLYYGEALSDDITLSNEHSAFDWVTLQGLLEKDLPEKYKAIAQQFLEPNLEV